jgi:arsenate reductase (glutaredoxin)
MAELIIYHNPRCSKSREALALLQARGCEPAVVDYMRLGLSADEIGMLLRKLGKGARALLRSAEPACRERGLDDPALDDAAIIAAMVAEPRLLQRPVVLRGERAVIARPAELALELLA